jgi:hypothetical protein
MSQDALALAADAPAKRARKRGPAAIVRLDGRTQVAHRTRELIASFVSSLGGAVTPTQSVDVRRAAELLALAEARRAAALRDPATTDLDALIRLEGAADRAVRRLEIKAAAIPKSAASASERAP